MSERESGPRLASTGVQGLDEVLGGGLPRKHLYLLEGESGTGKTTLGLQFALAGVAAGERSLYLSLSESAAALVETAIGHGWDVRGLDISEMRETQEEGVLHDQYTLFHPSEVDVNDGISHILEAVEHAQPERIVLAARPDCGPCRKTRCAAGARCRPCTAGCASRRAPPCSSSRRRPTASACARPTAFSTASCAWSASCRLTARNVGACRCASCAGRGMPRAITTIASSPAGCASFRGPPPAPAGSFRRRRWRAGSKVSTP